MFGKGSGCKACERAQNRGGTHCRKCTMGGGGTGGYRSVDLPAKTAADIRREQTQQQRAAQRTKAAADRARRHQEAMDRAAAAKAKKRGK
jgi:hypothetical protein